MPEAVRLLAIDERSGVVRGDGELRYGLAGTMLLELGLHGRLLCEGRRLTVADQLPTDDPLLDEVLSLISHAGTPCPIRSWLLRITRAIDDLQPRYLDRLARAGLVRHEQSRALGFFSTDH
ncbi:MAG: GPP34 family phosphoprotein, partial [Roseiflexaceae bacterium]